MYKVITGVDLITGEKLSLVDRGLTAICGLLPVVGGTVGRKAINLIGNSNLVKNITKFADEIATSLKSTAQDSADFIGKLVKEYVSISSKNVTLGTGFEAIQGGLDNLRKALDNVKAASVAKAVSEVVEILQNGTHLVKNSIGKVVGLEPNVVYKSGEFDYLYKTDESGRIKTVDVEDLKLSGTPRAKHNPNTPGKLDGDHAGHLIAYRFGGLPEIDKLISQLSSDNLSGYKKLENTWAKAIDDGQNVEIKISLKYNGSDLRPNQYIVDYIINGVPNRRIFNN